MLIFGSISFFLLNKSSTLASLHLEIILNLFLNFSLSEFFKSQLQFKKLQKSVEFNMKHVPTIISFYF